MPLHIRCIVTSHVGEQFVKMSNDNDLSAVAIMKDSTVAGHLPRETPRTLCVFLF